MEGAHERTSQARLDLAKLDPPVSISTGLAVLEDCDTLATLIGRADEHLREGRRKR